MYTYRICENLDLGHMVGVGVRVGFFRNATVFRNRPWRRTLDVARAKRALKGWVAARPNWKRSILLNRTGESRKARRHLV